MSRRKHGSFVLQKIVFFIIEERVRCESRSLFFARKKPSGMECGTARSAYSLGFRELGDCCAEKPLSRYATAPL